ncbi:MAG: ATP-binding protein [Flavobacterium sp.]|uniref:ATP-binding protein n=1 Tax=Flavobacterium sp. TaxID=239 RepID=UPI002633B85E|nr:ATP-binding protein [Flavobacterium sp.]MDD5151974.1 ATP-binding protein [Flavobacterium sp.]
MNDLVAIQNNANLRIEPLKLSLYINNTINAVTMYGFDNNVTIINRVPKNTLVSFNSAYLESVLLNLTTNAIKYAHPDRLPVIEFDFCIKKNKKVLAVKDNGLGIDLEKYEKLLFGLYNTFHNNDKASGIGLYITKNQIEDMKGKINVTSEVGEGTVFEVVFND